MKTKLAEELGLEFPIFAFTHCRDVAAAVSKAGGLGVLGVAGHSLHNLEMEMDWIEKQIGDKPYGVDLLLPTKFVGSDQGGIERVEARRADPRRAPPLPRRSARAPRRAAAAGGREPRGRPSRWATSSSAT